MTVRAAVIGCGDVSTVHLDAIAGLADAELVAVCDTDEERVDAASRRHGVAGFTDHLELIDRVRPDVVHVCTPHASHAQIAIDALERDVHTIIEKPVARDPHQAAELVSVAERSAAKSAVCFQNRYNAPVTAARELLRSGRVGRVLGASGSVIWHRTPEYYAAAPWRGTWAGGGGGLLMNQAIHTLDLLRWLVGPVVSVAGSAARRALPIEVEDTAEMTLTHRRGVRSVFYATVAHAANEPVTVDIVAENAHLHLQGDLEIVFADGSVEHVADELTATGERAYWGVSHARLIADFYRRLPDPEPFWISPAVGAEIVGMIHDVYATSFPEALASLTPDSALKRSTIA